MAWFFGAVIFVLALIGGLYWRWRKRVAAEIAEGAEIEWAHFQKNEPDFLAGMSREKFDEIYAYVMTPRFPGYALAAFVSFCAALPATFIFLSGLIFGARSLGLIPEPVEVADRLLLDGDQVRFFKSAPPEAALYYIQDLGGFYYFFGVLFVWLVIVAFFMKRYHARRPGYLRDEIIRNR
ncbi:MAG: hypothetical protein AAGA09_07340 [Pseudomonadota bacterium]